MLDSAASAAVVVPVVVAFVAKGHNAILCFVITKQICSQCGNREAETIVVIDHATSYSQNMLFFLSSTKHAIAMLCVCFIFHLICFIDIFFISLFG